MAVFKEHKELTKWPLRDYRKVFYCEQDREYVHGPQGEPEQRAGSRLDMAWPREALEEGKKAKKNRGSGSWKPSHYKGSPGSETTWGQHSGVEPGGLVRCFEINNKDT